MKESPFPKENLGELVKHKPFFKTYIGGRPGNFNIILLDNHQVYTAQSIHELYDYICSEVIDNRKIIFTAQPQDVRRAYTDEEINGFVQDYINHLEWEGEELDEKDIVEAEQQYRMHVFTLKQPKPLSQLAMSKLRKQFNNDEAMQGYDNPFDYQPSLN